MQPPRPNRIKATSVDVGVFTVVSALCERGAGVPPLPCTWCLQRAERREHECVDPQSPRWPLYTAGPPQRNLIHTDSECPLRCPPGGPDDKPCYTLTAPGWLLLAQCH